MSEYDNTNRGALFKNDRKEKETQPDYKGSLNVAGVDYWVSSWLSTSKAGAKYVSLSVQPKEERQPEREATSATVVKDADFDDDIPFAFAWVAPLAGMLMGLGYAGHVVAVLA